MMNLLSQKITLFLVIGLLVITLAIPYAIYLNRRDITGIGVGVMIVAIVGAVGVIALDRLAVRFVTPGWLSLVELVLFLVVGGWISYTNRTVTLDFSANPSPYIIVIWTNGGPADPPLESRLPFDKVAVVPTGTVALLDQQLFSLTDVKIPAHWEGHFSRGTALTHPRFVSAYFYGPESYAAKPAEVDSLVRQTVAQQDNR